MKKFTLLFLLLKLLFSLHAQNNCPLNIRVSTEVGTCYNNCMINIALVDGDNNPLDVSTTDLSDVKYFKIDMNTGDTAYSTTNSFMVSVGTYKVGVEAVCYHSTSSDSMYVRMSKDTLVTTRTSYTTPVLSMINNEANSATAYGTVHSLSCQNTGRVQLKITGGSFPYFIEMRDESGVPMDTVVFHDHQYTGNDYTQYDYKDYYSFDSLAPGKYYFYVWDGCGYHLPIVWQEVKTVELPHITDVCFYGKSYLFSKDAVVHGITITIGGNTDFYRNSFRDVVEYRFIYPEINGVRDTTPWQHFNQNPTSPQIYITFEDTVHSANSFCDLYGKYITFQSRNALCEEFSFTKSYLFNKMRDDMFSTGSSIVPDSSVTISMQYDSCGYRASSKIEYGSPRYYLTCSKLDITCYYQHNRAYHYTPPVYCVYTDTSTHNIIKIDSSFSNSEGYIGDKYSYLTPDDIIPLYGSFENSSITIPVQRTVIDKSGCELYSRFDNLTFDKRLTTAGGIYYHQRFEVGYSTPYYNKECCTSRRLVMLVHRDSPPMSYHGNAVVKLITSPENNKYNFTATYDQDSQQWTIVKDSISNLAIVNMNTSGNLGLQYGDFCMPSGTYTFQITTPCSTYVISKAIKFPDIIEDVVAERAEYELIPNCTELYIKPVGKYERIVRNHNANTGLPTQTTSIISGYFRIIDGPTGGYSTTEVREGGSLRVTMPGTYVIRMSNTSGNETYCYTIHQYDTIYFSGGTVEFDYAMCYVCDTTATTGFVRVKGKHGTEPYRYSLYSAPNMAGTLLGENTTGRFDNIPLRSGQQVSVKITDSCMASFHVNVIVVDLENTKKSWFANGLDVATVCEGHHVQIYALGSEDYFLYVWTGPNGFSASTRDATAFIPRDAEEGYYKVTLLNTGCANPIIDSIYVSVNRAPKVIIADSTTVCPGEEVQLTFTASGTGDVHYTIGHEENSAVSYQNYTNSDSYSYNPFSSGIFWVHEVSDNLCVYSIPEDTVAITLKGQVSTSCDVLTFPDTVCPDGTAVLSAYSLLDAPYIIRWYDDLGQLHLLQTDTILRAAGQSQYSLSSLVHDTTLFVTVSNNTYCETQNGTILRWMDMQAGSSLLKCGESIKLYDSGGPDSPYSKFENIKHTFTSIDGSPLILRFNSFITDTYSRLLVFTGSGTSPDSILATLSGDMNSSLPADIISSGASMTLMFVSTGETPSRGWDAVISNNPHPAAATASVIDSVKLHLSPITALPVHYNGNITLQATATGGKSPQFEYQWFSSEDGNVWSHGQTVVTNDTSYYNISNLIKSLHVKVVVRDVSPTTCGIADTAVYYIPISNIKLSLSLSVSTDDPCVSHNAVLSVRNDGQETAEDIVCHVQAPEGLFELFGHDVLSISSLGPGESWTDTFRLSLTNRLAVDTVVALKAQIWSCRQGDSVPEVVYGDWDWQGAPRYADEDSANIRLLPSFSDSEYSITTINDEVCYGNDAQLVAFSDLAAPQYFNWYADAALSQLIQRDTVYHAGGHALHNLSNLQTNTTRYVTLRTAEKCPPMTAGVMVYKLETPATDTVIMHNGITYVGAESHIKFYDSGGPEGNPSAEEFIHTFSTEEGEIIVFFRNISVNGLRIYDGNSISGRLLLEGAGTFSNRLFTSTTGSITVRSLNSGEFSSYYGWEADVVNSQTFKSAEALATIKAPSANIDISATHDTVCHGETAVLTASSTIGFPQYFTWYNSDWSNVVLRDTLTSGVSVLELPNLKTTENFYVTVHNDTTCPLFVAKDTLINKHIASSSQYSNQTIFMMRNESVTFTDEGGQLGNYSIMPVGKYITTFTAIEGTVKAVFPSNTSQNRLSTSDTLYVYNGLEGDSLLFRGTGTAISNKTFQSSGNTLTFKFVKNNNTSYNYGWHATITNIPGNSNDTTQVWAYVRGPGAGQRIVATSDTVCYNGTALLQASAPEVGHPQYYTWICQDLKNIVYQDTVDGTIKTESTLLLENQQRDTLYYVTLKTDTVCPSMFYDDSIFIATPILKKKYDFLMTADKHNLTTEMQCTDSIRFLDNGGLSGYYANNMNVTHIFTSIDNEPVQIVLSDFRTYNSSDYLYLYDGASTSAPLLKRLYGNLTSSVPITCTANSGSLTVRWVTNNAYTQSGWEGYITTATNCTAEVNTASVHVLPEIPAASIAQTTCQSATPFSYMGFNDIDVSVPGDYTIDSVFTSSLGCDSAVTLNLTVAPIFFHEENAETCGNVPYVWTGHSVTIPTTVGSHIVWDSLKTANNCDSVYKLNLTVHPTFFHEESAETCDNVPYVWAGHSVAIPTTAGSHIVWDSLKTANNCDSIYKLNLTVYPTFNKDTVFKDTLYVGIPYDMTVHNVIFHVDRPGLMVKYDTLHTAFGCDSIQTIILTVHKSIVYYDTVCQSQVNSYTGPYHTLASDLFGQTTLDSVVKASGYIYKENVYMSDGLGNDSVVSFYLNVTPPLVHDTTVVITNMHGGYDWHGSTYTESGLYAIYTQQSGGCDVLNILTLQKLQIDTTANSICYGDSTVKTITATMSDIEFKTDLISRPVLPGDILCTDGTILVPDSFASSGKTAKGVVFYTDKEKGTGLAVALTDVNNSQWGPSTICATSQIRRYEDALLDMKGLENTQNLIMNATNPDDVTSAYECYYYDHTTLGVGTEPNGWYLPSAGELRLLYNSRQQVNTTLNILGASNSAIFPLNYYYWSSTEYSALNAWLLYDSGMMGFVEKSLDRNTRAITSFTYTPTQLINVGDLYTFEDGSQGIVCYVEPGLPQKGWVAALKDLDQKYAIYTGSTIPDGWIKPTILPDSTSLSVWQMEGEHNTQLLRASGNSPAAQAVDFDHGWYIPDAVQLATIVGLIPVLNEQFVAVGGSLTELSSHSEYYWSSTLSGQDYHAFYLYNGNFGGGMRKDKSNNLSYNVRAVRNFGDYEPNACWTISPDTNSILVSPATNTAYDAEVTFGPDTFRLQSSVIVYPVYPSDTLSPDTICISDVTSNIVTINNHTYTNVTTPGSYYATDSLFSIHGCDSVVVMILVVNEFSLSIASIDNGVCGGDASITLSATGEAPIEYSLDGIVFQSSNVFSGLASGSYTVTARDANGCTATTTAVISPTLTPSLTFTCPPDIRDTLAYGDCAMKIYPAKLGTPTAVHSLGWPFSITNNAPTDSLYPAGDNIVTWIMTDSVCGYADTCYQHILVVFPKCPDAVDCEGNVYAGVRIGCDCWTQRNLESTKYSDCTDIPCVYEYVSHEHPNVTENVERYGRLYCFEAAVRDSADNGHGHIQGICPAGWYLPTPEKYEALNAYGADALKSPLYWIPSGGNNSTGFSALPAGYYSGIANRFEGMLGETYFWSTSNTGSGTSSSAYSLFLNCEYFLHIQNNYGSGYSVRCIKEKE